MSINIGNRSMGRVLHAATKSRSYKAVWSILQAIENPLPWIKRYLSNSGAYPDTVRVKTPTGVYPVEMLFPDDLQTVVEIFCRRDYPVEPTDRIAIDIGGNIGVFSLYFLSRSKENRCYTFEPDPKNLEKARKTLSGEIAQRVHLHPLAVHWESGTLRFNSENTGRYGTLQTEGVAPPAHVTVIEVKCADINDVIRDVVQKEGRVDVIKVDIEGNEVGLLQHIKPELYPHVKRIIFETNMEPPVCVLTPPTLSAEEFQARLRPFILK